MKRFMSGIAAGVILSIITYFVVGMVSKIGKEEIVVDHVKISGEDIIHSDIKIKKNVLEFNTTSQGKGKSRTKIKIPFKKHIIQGGVSYVDKGQMSLNYLRNFGNMFALGAGCIVSKDKFEGVQFIGQIMF